MLGELLARDERRMRRWVDSVLAPMRRAVNILESMLDPDAIVLGGFLPLPILTMLYERLDPLPPSVGARRTRNAPRILLGAAGPDTAALGAAALPIFDEINPQFD